MKKFELTSEFKINLLGKKVFRIKALIDIKKYEVKAGDLGGYIESDKNLSQEGNAWVSGNARVSGDAWVSGNARVSGNAWVSGDARVSGDAWVSGNARVSGNAWVSGDAEVSGNAEVSGDADYAIIKGFGTCHRNTTFFKCEDGLVRVACGCFRGTIEEFRKQVKNTRSGKVAEEYLLIADLMEKHFTVESEVN